jgi:hypothetical protein
VTFPFSVFFFFFVCVFSYWSLSKFWWVSLLISLSGVVISLVD